MSWIRALVGTATLAAFPMASTMANDKPLSAGNLVVVELPADALKARKIETIALGDLELPTGRVVAADPLVNPERPPFAREVAPGRYPVTLYKAQYRIAMAAVRFQPGNVARWEMATLPGQDLAKLGDDEIYGYPVDAGTGCFMDATAAKAMEKRETIQIEAQRGTSDSYSNYYDDVVAAEMAPNDDNYALHKPLPDDPVNVAIFQSGWGDGFYASYWGLDESGKPLVLVTDFGVMEGADGRDEFQKKHDALVAAMSPEQQAANREAYEALQRGDIAGLEDMLAAGRIGPDAYIVEQQEGLVLIAIRRDKPEFLELLVRYGAPTEVPARYDYMKDKTYPGFARWLHAQSRKEDVARKRKENGYGPISDELIEVVARWETGSIPIADDAQVSRTQDKRP